MLNSIKKKKKKKIFTTFRKEYFFFFFNLKGKASTMLNKLYSIKMSLGTLADYKTNKKQNKIYIYYFMISI
jgi:hypothetical protein